MKEINRVLRLELDAEKRRNESLHQELMQVESECRRWRDLAIAARQQLEALQRGETIA